MPTAQHGINVFVDKIKADGYELVDPGQYPDSTTDFTDVIKTFMDADIDILCGTNTNPNFADLWNQATAAGLDPAVVTMGKAYLLQSDAEAIGRRSWTAAWRRSGGADPSLCFGAHRHDLRAACGSV
jgi:ABC-type branched-subunit amino acid transport system substrate-binding protein